MTDFIMSGFINVILMIFSIVYVVVIPLANLDVYYEESKEKEFTIDFWIWYKDTKEYTKIGKIIYYIISSFCLVWLFIFKILDFIYLIFNKIMFKENK